MTFKFVDNDLQSFLHLFLLIHTLLLSRSSGFFVISYVLGLVPHLSDSLFYILVHAVLTSLLREC